jgi:hypothetical protein
MAGRVPQDGRLTLGGDKGSDTREFVAALRDMAVTPHVTRNRTNRSSAIDDRGTRHLGYAVSQRARMRIEEVFGWLRPSRCCEDPAPRHRPSAARDENSPFSFTRVQSCFINRWQVTSTHDFRRVALS